MRKLSCTRIVLAALAMCWLSFATSYASANAGEQIKWQVLACGGSTNGTSSGYIVSGTLGQPTVGSGSSTSYGVSHGFWQHTVTSYLCGDADGNDIITISDAVYLINYVFAGGPAPNPLLSGDADCSGFISISDAVALINYIFAGGPAPCASCP